MARMNVRQMWAAKLAGKPMPAAVAVPCNAAPTAALSAGVRAKTAFAGQVLGIDPSLRGSGLALIEFRPGRAPVMLRCQTVKVPPRRSMPEALAEIHRAVSAFLNDFDVVHVALEQTIYVQNFQTAQILGAARPRDMPAHAVERGEAGFRIPAAAREAGGGGRGAREQGADGAHGDVAAGARTSAGL